MKYGVVIVAAGLSSRMKRFKPLLEIDGVSMLQRVVINFQRCGIRNIVVVVGYHGDELENEIKKWGVVCVNNPDYASTQMLDSAKIGFRHLESSCDKVFFCPVDVPLFTEETVNWLMSENQAELISPVYQGQKGHPILIDCSLLPRIIAYNGENGLQGALSSVKEKNIEVDDRGILMDADTQEDFSRLLCLHNERLHRPQVQVRLAGKNPFMGPGTARLLRQISYTNSIQGACKCLNISYSKGRAILCTIEQELGRCVVKRRQGGRGGGEAELTKYGESILEKYERLEREITCFAELKYKEIF